MTSPRQPISPQGFSDSDVKQRKQAESHGQTTNFVTIVQSLQKLLYYTIISYANSFKELFNAIGQHLHTVHWPDNKFILHGIQEFFVREFSVDTKKLTFRSLNLNVT